MPKRFSGNPEDLEVGHHIIYTDEYGQPHDALVTAIWNGGDASKTAQSSINVVYVDPKEGADDQYGRQVRRDATSVVPRPMQSAHGRFWSLD